MKYRILVLTVALASLQTLTSGSALAAAPGAGARPAIFAPPSLDMAFGAASIPVGGHTTLGFKVGNTNAGYKLIEVAFTDTLPSGLVIATPNNLGGTCVSVPGVAILAQAGTRYVKLTQLNFDDEGSCDISIDVTGATPGLQTNTTSTITGCIYCPDLLTGPAVSKSIVVVAAPSIAAVFAPATIAAGATTYVTFTITNPAGNTVPLTGVGFTATLPTGLSVSSTTAPMCGGTLTLSPSIGVVLSGASIATGSPCQFSLMFAGVPAGSYTIATSHVGSTNGGSGNAATAHLTAPTPTPTPTPTPSASPSETAAPSASATAAAVVASSPSPASNGSPAPADGGSNGMILVALGGIAALVLAGLLVALFIRRKRRETQSDSPA